MMFAVPLENISIDIPPSDFHFPIKDSLSFGIGSNFGAQEDNNVKIKAQHNKIFPILRLTIFFFFPVTINETESGSG